mgnify:CR=1 FL=1|tara:strand:+ start:7172 stop:7792 length:621 start_codon:yes stop_codon:yes gene_type:complete
MATLNATNLKHASSSSNNIVLAADGSTTISGNATCSGTATGFGGGKILKIESFVYKGLSSAQSNSNAYMATPLVCSITPSAANSKIYVSYSLLMGMGNNVRSGATVYRDINSGGFSQLDTVKADASGSNQRLTNVTNGANQWTPSTVSQTFVDSPSYSVGNSISYKLYTWAESNSTVYINRIEAHDSASAAYGVGVSTMTLMEISA